MPQTAWQRRRLPVCASTELELERWLEGQPPEPGQPLRRLVMAGRQRHGHGQQGRPWLSPWGGLWLSAAFDWPQPTPSSAPLALAAAVALALELERGLASRSLVLTLKWPNDLLVGGRKLAGLLPRLRWRGGELRWAQLGVGLNGLNPVPAGAISLAEALSPDPDGRCFHPAARPDRLLAPVLRALERTRAWAGEGEQVLAEAERRLWRPHDGLLHDGVRWQVLGLSADGGLRLARAGQTCVLQRRF